MVSVNELTVEDNIIIKGSRAVISASLHSEYLKALHKRHQCVESTQKGARKSVFQPSVNYDIQTAIQACSICNSLKPHQQKELLKLHTVPNLPWSVVATDIFEWNNYHYLVLVDSFSGLFETDQLSSLSSINQLKQHFSVHSIYYTSCTQTTAFST